MVTQDRECQDSLVTLVRECQAMVGMNRGEGQVVLLTEEVTLLATPPAPNKTFPRVTPVHSPACQDLATPRHQATPATTDSHSQHLREVTLPTMACQVQGVPSMLACLPTQEYHSQASLRGLRAPRGSQDPPANRRECLKDQDSLMLRVDHIYQGGQECQIWVQECQECLQEDQVCLLVDQECHQEDRECHLEDQECLQEDTACHQMAHL